MNRAYRIMIDPGHGGKDPGAIAANGLQEKSIVLDIGRLFRRCILNGDYLYYPYITRLSDRYLTLEARCKLANEKKADLFISLHCNSVLNPTAEGLEVWFYKKSIKSKLLAHELYVSVLSAIPGINGRGIKGAVKGDRAEHVLKHTTMPAALIEFEFFSNPKEYITDINTQRWVAFSMAETIEEFLEGGHHA